MILCEFNYCIYNKKSECILKTISISSMGFCENCLIPNIDCETLDKYKSEMLTRLKPNTIKAKK